MFYPSSTQGTSNAISEKVYHEGDWEMMQVAVKIDVVTKKLIPEGATASQHFYGQTLLWDIVEKSNKYNPVIYIAAGSHATYFSSGDFDTRLLGLYLGFVTPNDWTTPTKKKPDQYTLQPFEPFGVTPSWWLWGGHWGIQFSSPPSPKYTQRDTIIIFDDPNGFYNKFK